MDFRLVSLLVLPSGGEEKWPDRKVTYSHCRESVLVRHITPAVFHGRVRVCQQHDLGGFCRKFDRFL